jgi:hypothetical protein
MNNTDKHPNEPPRDDPKTGQHADAGEQKHTGVPSDAKTDQPTGQPNSDRHETEIASSKV